MNQSTIEKHFARMGARVKFRDGALRLDVRRDRDGSFFDMGLSPDLQIDVIDVQPSDRHLLLMTRDRSATKQKFLCGHDERNWFVAGVAREGVSNVATAKASLMPQEARTSLSQKKAKSKKRLKRKNQAFQRQGEWFFIPAPHFKTHKNSITLKNEPIRRGRARAHMCQHLCRSGGEAVYVNTSYPEGLTGKQRTDLFNRDPAARKLPWRPMQRNARVYVKGRITAPDHKPLVLDVWHHVVPNLEQTHGRSVAFLD